MYLDTLRELLGIGNLTSKQLIIHVGKNTFFKGGGGGGREGGYRCVNADESFTN